MYKRKNYTLIFSILFVCLLTLSVGLATLSSALNINGSATANGSKWDIHFTSITKTGGSTGATGNSGTIVGGTSIENLQASLPYVGTYIEYTAVIKNESDYPAFLNYYHLNTNLTCSGGTATENKNVCDYITVTVSGVGSGDLTTFPRMNGSLYNEPLVVNATRTIKIRVDYDKNNQATIDKLVNKPISINNINLTIQYSYGTGTQSDANIANAIKTSSIGSIVTLNNTVGKKIDSFTLFGDAIQNGTPSPTNPVPVNVVTGNNTIIVGGKNLIDSNYAENGSINGGNGYNDDYPPCARGSNYIPVLPNTQYTLSVNKNYAYLRISEYNINKSHIIRKQGTNTSFTITTGPNTYYVRWSMNYNDNTTMTKEFVKDSNLQLEIGSVATSYEPYRGIESYPINLGSIELAKIDDAQDSITYENNKWYLNKNIRHLSLNISDMNNGDNYPGWTSISALKNDYPDINNKFGVVGIKMMSNITNNNYKVCLNSSGTSGILFFIVGGDNSLFGNLNQTQIKSTYPNLVFDIYYVMPNVEKTQITDSTLVSQLNALKNAYTVVGNTIISTNGNNINPLIQVRY